MGIQKEIVPKSRERGYFLNFFKDAQKTYYLSCKVPSIDIIKLKNIFQ